MLEKSLLDTRDDALCTIKHVGRLAKRDEFLSDKSWDVFLEGPVLETVFLEGPAPRHPR